MPVARRSKAGTMPGVRCPAPLRVGRRDTGHLQRVGRRIVAHSPRDKACNATPGHSIDKGDATSRTLVQGQAWCGPPSAEQHARDSNISAIQSCDAPQLQRYAWRAAALFQAYGQAQGTTVLVQGDW
ncbi:hypothetical protein HAX54_044147 [Datura stramonium]|uniref:Uncharacterized protein n=1 Tax=Datura stramonium TaxID=4076 RepID=A0ABS8W3J0_DATST|nr:hypothetical protein [Datura stramonium]